MIEPPTIPPPDELPRDDHVCGHGEHLGRRSDGDMIRCGGCGAPLEPVRLPKLQCSCQRANAYDTECLLTGRCAEGRRA